MGVCNINRNNQVQRNKVKNPNWREAHRQMTIYKRKGRFTTASYHETSLYSGQRAIWTRGYRKQFRLPHWLGLATSLQSQYFLASWSSERYAPDLNHGTSLTSRVLDKTVWSELVKNNILPARSKQRARDLGSWVWTADAPFGNWGHSTGGPAQFTSPGLVSFLVKLAEEFLEKYICKL